MKVPRPSFHKHLRQTSCLALMALAALNVASCGKSPNDRAEDIGNSGQNLLRASDIMFNWKGPCVQSDLLNLGANAVLKFGANTFERELSFFANDRCEDAAFKVKYQGEYTVGSDDNYPEGLSPVDFSITTVTVTALNDGGDKLLDNTDFCGQEVWTKGEEIDLSNNSSDLGCMLDDLPRSGFDIFRVKENELQMGRTGVLPPTDDQAQRPKELSKEIFTRQ